MPSTTWNASATWTVPANADTSTVRVQTWGESGLAGTSSHGVFAGGGSGGGAYGEETHLGGLVAGSTTLTITIPQGGTGNPVTVTGGSVTVQANAGASASGQTAGNGGAAGANTVAFRGGNGASGFSGGSQNGGGGGGSAGPSGAGGDASASTGGTAGAGGGTAGQSGAGTSASGNSGTAPGGGASGGGSGGTFNHTGGNGAAGQVTITWSLITWSGTGYASATSRTATAKQASSGFKGYLPFTGAPLPVRPVNQWSASFTQPASFQNMPPALQSVVVPLTPAASVGGGSGVPSPGNWLFAVTGITEPYAASGFTVAAGDDVRSWWRPGDVTQSSWAVSPANALTRTSVWYTPNLDRAPSAVYIAPDGPCDAITVLVIEVAGLGPWDTVTGIYSNYAAAATSLNLTLAAPPGPAFLLAAAAGNLTTAGQALAPAGWTALHAVTATNGTDHTSDSVLTSACIATSGSVSVNATASSEDISGVVIGVLQNGPSPVPAGANPAWPGRVILEAAFGAGFQTPPDQLTWTQLSDSAAAPGTMNKRFWSWADDGGVQYQLGGLQSGTGTIQLDNSDGALSPARVGASGPWSFPVSGTPAAVSYFTVTTAQAAAIAAGQAFTDVTNTGTLFTVTSVGAPSGGLVNVSFSPPAAHVMASGDTVTQISPLTGTPVRLRCALGTVKGTTYNRWRVIARNALTFPERRSKALRGFVPMAITDQYSVMSGTCATPYRGEVEQDSPGWWWPCDDQPLAGGVLPVSLRNAAAGSSTALNITASPNGLSALSPYSTSGVNLGTASVTPSPSVSLPVYQVAQQQGWMYGDPPSSPQSIQAGGPVTAQPGSAAWQQAGQLGSGGAHGWFLSAHDTFPSLTSGCTVEGWFNTEFFGSTAATSPDVGNPLVECGQPYSVFTLFELATGTAPVAAVQLDLNGHLTVTTYNSGASNGTSTVYSGSDLRCTSWIHVVLTLTGSGWTCYLNGGITAKASGSATIGPAAWTWLVACGDLGSSGGSSLAAIQHGWNGYISHLAVYPQVLTPARILARYCAAVTGFGAVPAPASLALSAVASSNGDTCTPDGSESSGQYGGATSGGVGSLTPPYSMSAVAAAVIGSFTSGPSARTTRCGLAVQGPSDIVQNALWLSWVSTAPLIRVFTAATAATETEAAACLGAGDSFISGFGVTASGHGVCQVSAGTGASPPSAPSALGDTAGQRLERILGYAGLTYPGRCIDPSPPLVQAAVDAGGQAAGQNLDNIRQSDDGLLSIDGNGYLCYRQRSRLAADTPAWHLGPDTASGQIPYMAGQEFTSDPQRVWDVIRITPYAPDGATLPSVTPSDAAAADAAQEQYGPRPLSFSSYLQSQAEMQAQADWILAQFGQLRRRVPSLKVDAASHPAAWNLVLGCNVGDLATVTDTPFGAPATTGTFRVTSLSRKISYGAGGSAVEGSVTLVLDYEPSSYWS